MGILMKILLPLAAVFLLQYIYNLVLFFGYHKRIIKHSPGKCHLVPGVEEGSEDIQTLSNGVAIITSGVRYGAMNDDPVLSKRKGAFYKFDFNNVAAGAQKIRVEGATIDNPHGLGIWEDEGNGKVIVFLVNHPKNGEFIEKLEYDGKANVLRHISSVTNPSMTCLNDVLATGPDSFYVTNNKDCFFMPELFLSLKRGSVLHCQGTSCSTAAEGLVAPNGINMSPDGKYVYVSNPVGKSLEIFGRSPDNKLTYLETVVLDTLPDNIDVSKINGDLWLGCNPIVWKIFKTLGDPSYPGPSQVLRLKIKEGKVSSIEEVHAGNGELIHSSTIANYHNGGMLVGTVADKLMYCEVNYLQD